METCSEFVRSQRRGGGDVWLSCEDTIAYIFGNNSHKDTMYRSSKFFNRTKNEEDLNQLEHEIENWTPPDGEADDEELESMAFRRKYRRRYAETGDDIDIDRYLDGNRRDIWEEQYKDKQETDCQAVTYLLDITVPWGDRRDTRLARQAIDLYKAAVKNERLGIPTRIIGVRSMRYDEGGVYRFFIVIKDWNEAMNRYLFGWFVNNDLTNRFGALFSAFVMGTKGLGGGYVLNTVIDAARDFPGEAIKFFPGNTYLKVVN